MVRTILSRITLYDCRQVFLSIE